MRGYRRFRPFEVAPLQGNDTLRRQYVTQAKTDPEKSAEQHIYLLCKWWLGTLGPSHQIEISDLVVIFSY